MGTGRTIGQCVLINRRSVKKGLENAVLLRLSWKFLSLNIGVDTITLNSLFLFFFFFFLVISALGNSGLVLYQDFASKAI